MLTIPSGDAARQAWAALPDHVRAEVRRYAANDQGHPDPAVAAVAVGQARAERVWPWWRTTLLGLGMCLFFGECLALAASGGSIRDLSLRDSAVVVLPALIGFALLTGVPALRTPGWLPRPAEVANLRIFLAADGAHAGRPAANKRWLTRRRATVGAAIAIGIAAVAYTAITVMDGRPKVGNVLSGGSIVVVILAAQVLFRRIRRAPRQARRVTVAEDGLRFDDREKIPWSDVTGATVSGPTATRPEDEGLIVWIVRGDQPTVETSLHGSGLPEELILAARHYVAAAKQAA